MAPEFEWDAQKAEENLKNHRVALEEALTVFADPLANIFDDPDHSAEERRELIIGHAVGQRLLIVSFTDRGRRTRIIGQDKRQRVNARTRSKTARRNPRRDSNGMRAEYELDYSRAKPNRFAAHGDRPVVAVVLEPDVASVFDSSAKVNAQLRSIIAARAEKTVVSSTEPSPQGGLTAAAPDGGPVANEMIRHDRGRPPRMRRQLPLLRNIAHYVRKKDPSG